MNEANFIEANKHRPIAELALLLSKIDLDSTYILAQINGIQKAKKKLPEFYNTPGIVYPTKLSMEQCSSEQTAIFKSKIIAGNSLTDLTGGFGIDSYYFSKQYKQVTYIEQNAALSEIATKNFQLLNSKNIDIINTTAEEYLDQLHQKVDVIYIDPSRRNEAQRVFMLEDCTPNVITLMPQLLQRGNRIIVKTAPLLDIKKCIKELEHVSSVMVVSLNNECKEVLYILESAINKEVQIHAINLGKNYQEFSFNYAFEADAKVTYSEPLSYLYEPNASILKSGAFNYIAERYLVNKLNTNTHLYTSTNLAADFPGRIFKINNVIPYSTKEFKKLNITKANISCRNFKDNPEQVKKKLQLKDGGNSFLFATTDLNGKPILVICVK